MIELKNAADEDATIWSRAYNQLQTYKQEIPSLLHYNEVLVISDGLEARIGSLTANQEWFKPWRTIEGEVDAPKTALELEMLVRGVFEKRRFLDLRPLLHRLRGRSRHRRGAQEDGRLPPVPRGQRRGRGNARASGKDRTAEAAGHLLGGQDAGRRRRRPPRRRRLAHAGLGQEPDDGSSTPARVDPAPGDGEPDARRAHRPQRPRRPALRHVLALPRAAAADAGAGRRPRATCAKLLNVASRRRRLHHDPEVPPRGEGRAGIRCSPTGATSSSSPTRRTAASTTSSTASPRHMRDALPNASFIGFTGTPIEQTDANTRAVFGDYISIYDIQRAVEDGATVPIYYESRLAKLELNRSRAAEDRPRVRGGHRGRGGRRARRSSRRKWAAARGAGRDREAARARSPPIWSSTSSSRLEAMDGKAMIVCMSRRICVELYNAIVTLRPDWHRTTTTTQAASLKVVMTGSRRRPARLAAAHPQQEQRRERWPSRFKDPDDPFKIVIVRDMWLTGFDAPCLHTMYVDKPMRGHGLMQAIARVNRVFRDKPGGLVVDYLGLADELKQALATYTESGGTGNPSIDTAQGRRGHAGEVRDRLRHVPRLRLVAVARPARRPRRLALLPAGAGAHPRAGETARTGSCRPSPSCRRRSPSAPAATKRSRSATTSASSRPSGPRSPKHARRPEDRPKELDHAIRQIVSKAIVPEGEVIDIFAAAGLKKPDISILSDEFLAEVRGLQTQEPRRRAAGEAAQRRDQGALEAQPRAEPRVLRDAGADAQRLPEPRDRDAE